MSLQALLQDQPSVLGRSELLQLGLFQDHVLFGRILIAADDGLGFHFAVDRADLVVVDPLPAVGMELIERDRLGGARGRIGLHRHDDQTQPQEAGPTGTAACLDVGWGRRGFGHGR